MPNGEIHRFSKKFLPLLFCHVSLYSILSWFSL